MPDWSYQTVFRPILFRMPFETARNLCLGSMGRLARTPGGPWLIGFLGHMAPDDRLNCQLGELNVASPVGLAAGIDANHVATSALARFGVGFIEVGPVALKPSPARDPSTARDPSPIQLLSADESLLFPDGLPATDADELVRRINRYHGPCPVFVRLRVPTEPCPDDAHQRLHETVSSMAAVASGLTIEFDGSAEESPDAGVLKSVVETARAAGMRGPVCLRLRDWPSETVRAAATEAARHSELDGLIFDGAVTKPDSATVRLGPANTSALVAAIGDARAKNSDLTLIACGGIHEPAHALRLMHAGADAVMIDSGLVFGGPGLAKRTNEAIIATRPDTAETSGNRASVSMTRQSWFWAMLLSIALLGGGMLALSIASTRVVLPYDETLVGMTIDELCGVNDQLLPFLTHDRVTLSGTMLADGILYFGLALWGIRAGFHWARVTVLTSSMVGFFSFFLFLGFGYFDPFHAFVTAVVFQLVLFTMYAECRSSPHLTCPDLHNDRAWRIGLLGQLVFLIHGAAIAVGGLVICSYGVTTVFVQEDLDFMRTTAEALREANPQLVPMIAHDRASFGGMLVSCGVATFLCALWGFRRGAVWLWWSLLLSGLVAYGATIAVHIAVGYTSLRHLLPAYGGLAALIVGSALTARWMLARPDHDDMPRR